MLTTNFWLRVIASMQINAILFGIGAVTVLSVPPLAADAKIWLFMVVVASFALSPLLAGFIARRMRIREWGRATWKHGDIISG